MTLKTVAPEAKKFCWTLASAGSLVVGSEGLQQARSPTAIWEDEGQYRMLGCEMAGTDPATHEQMMTLERTVGQRIHAFSNMISGHFFSRTEQSFGVSLPEWRVLRSVLIAPGASQGEVASAEGLNVMNVSRAVAGLRRKGLIRVEPDTEDRRRTLLSATANGIAIGADIGTRERLVYEHVFSVLTSEEVEQLDDLLGRVNDGLRDTELPSAPPASSDWAEIVSSHEQSQAQ